VAKARRAGALRLIKNAVLAIAESNGEYYTGGKGPGKQGWR
jgi:hypothetical protein